MEIKSNILQVPYQNLTRSDLSTLGSALIAGYSTGVLNNIDEIKKKSAGTGLTILPVKGENTKYMKYIEVYRDLFPLLNEIYRRLSE